MLPSGLPTGQPLLQHLQGVENTCLLGHQVCRGWTCFFCQEPRNFAQESAFSAHVKAFHQDAVSEAYLGDLSTACQIIDEPTLDMCPVCSMHEAAWRMKKTEISNRELTRSWTTSENACMVLLYGHCRLRSLMVQPKNPVRHLLARHMLTVARPFLQSA